MLPVDFSLKAISLRSSEAVPKYFTKTLYTFVHYSNFYAMSYLSNKVELLVFAGMYFTLVVNITNSKIQVSKCIFEYMCTRFFVFICVVSEVLAVEM